MKQTKRILVVLLAVVMLLCVVPVMNLGMTASAAGGVKAKLDAFIQIYPSGNRWTGTFDGGRECYGFGKMAIYNVFGKNSSGGYRSWSYAGVSTSGMNLLGQITNYSASNVQSLLRKASVGDILQFDSSNQHTMIVYGVESDGVWIYDCNNDYNCGIRLAKVSFGRWSGRNSAKLSLLRSDNYDTVNGISEPTAPTLMVSSQNVSNKDVTFTWNKVSNVDHYDLRVYNYGDYNVGAPYGEFGISGSRTSSSIRLPKGKYAAYITAVSSSGAEAPSDWIAPIVVSNPPETPTLTINNIFVTDNIDNDGVEFKWTKTANTDHYDLRVYNHGDYNTGAPYTAFDLPASQTSTKMKLPIGKYAAYITAVSESGAEAPSEWITVFNVLEPDANANFPTNIKTYKMWTGDTSTVGYDCSNYNQANLTDSELKIIKVYNNNWVKAEATVSGATKAVYIPLGGIIGTPCTVTTKYCKASTPVYRRYNNTTVYHTLAKDAAVKVIGTYQDTRTQICYTVSGQSYIGWVLNDTLCAHSSTGHTYTSQVTTAATCTTSGVRTYTCSCGASYTESITALNHSYGAWTKLNDTQHQRVCSRNSSHVEKANHTWNSGTVTKAATCTATGIRTYTCSVCNGTKTETIPVNSNNHVNTTNVAATASTCTVKGYTAGVYCNDCKKYISGHAEQPLAAHTLTTINHRDATYDAEGYTGDEYCTTCKQTITTGTAIPKLERPTDPTPSNPQPSGGCKWCGSQHGGVFGWLVRIIHNILAAIFGAKY